MVDADALFWADGRVLPAAGPADWTALGWHRAGGALVLAVTPGAASASLLSHAVGRAAAVADWPLARWDRALAEFWAEAGAALTARVRDLGLEPGSEVRAGAWTRLAWGAWPREGPPRVGIVAGSVPRPIRHEVDRLAEAGTEVAAWELRPAPEDGPLQGVRVAGAWSPAPIRPLPAQAEDGEVAPLLGPAGAAATDLLEPIETLARALGGRIKWIGGEWMRVAGPAGSLRLFPGPDGLDLQFAGADEGTRLGLAFRYGVRLPAEPPRDAPPGTHLRLDKSTDLDGPVGLMIRGWLSGAPAPDRPGRSD